MITKGLRHGVRQLADCRGNANIGDHSRFQDSSMIEPHPVALPAITESMARNPLVQSEQPLYHFPYRAAIQAPVLDCLFAQRFLPEGWQSSNRAGAVLPSASALASLLPGCAVGYAGAFGRQVWAGIVPVPVVVG
jgi:hypothetical protein